MSDPIRTCAGCGRKASKRELRRFVVRAGILAAARPSDPGRGVYTCKRLQCFERAASRRAFARTLRCRVSLDQGLERLYTERS